MSDRRWPRHINPVDLYPCDGCGWRYPVEILSVFVSDKANTKPICGVCALARSNEIHGITRRRFDGEMAEDFRQDTLAFRREHPEYAPKPTPPA